jgi:hypothetical protein
MRLPLKGDDYFTTNLNSTFDNVKDRYFEAIKPQLMMNKLSVMLGDGTVSQSDTFEPQKVIAFYQRLINSLHGWTTTGVSRSNTSDLHRVYCQFTQVVGKYHLHGYFGIQFHALPYYRVNKRVIEIQKELREIADNATKTFALIGNRGNDIVQQELEKVGCAEMGFEELFTKLFEDKELLDDLEVKALTIEKEFPEYEEMHNKKIQLFTELNDLVIETYQTTLVSIDYNKLMQGEEGIVTYFDIEIIKNQKTKERDSYINTSITTKELTKQIIGKLDEVAKILQNVAT